MCDLKKAVEVERSI